jgi:hypothetical protein
MKDFMDKVHMVKVEEEMKNMKIASEFTEWTF